MTSLLESWLPRSLLGRIFALLTTCVVLFTVSGLTFIFSSHFDQEIDDANESVTLLADIVQPTVSDSAVIGDYDTIQRTLNRLATGSSVALVSFTDTKGAIVEAKNTKSLSSAAPQWITGWIAQRLNIIEREVSVGGKNYGTLRLHISAAAIAADLWSLTRTYLMFALLLLAPSLYLARIPLKGIVADLAHVADFAANLKDHQGTELRLTGAAAETEHLAGALNQVSRELNARHQALAESESRKSAILAAGLDCFITIDYDGRIIDFNKAAESTFEYTADEVRGRLMSELLIPPDARASHEQGMERYRLTGDGPVLHRRIETIALRRSGEMFPIELAVVPFGSGERHYFAGFIRDITERRRLEGERERINHLLLQSVRELEYQKFALDQHAIVSIADANGKIIYVNEKFVEISGYGREELVGNTHRLVKSGIQVPAFYRDMWDTIRAGKTWHSELANRNKSGGIYWVAATIVPWSDEAGKPYQYVSIYTDITAQKKSEQDLAEARRRELETGYEIQRSLLFGDFSGEIHGTRIATYTEPSQGIDGDFYAITCFRPDCFELLAGDVMGKGVPAALVGAAVKSTYHMVLAELFAQGSGSIELPKPEDIINKMHRILTPRLVELDSFATLVLYRFDRSDNSLTYVNAGHTNGLLARGGTTIEELRGDNLPIGVLAEETYRQIRISVDVGDSLLMYSDGIVDAQNERHEDFGYPRLLELLQTGLAAGLPPTSLLQSLRQDVRNFVGHDILRDDQTALMVTLHPMRAGKRSGVGQRSNPTLLILPWQLDGLAPLRQRIGEFAGHLPADAIESLTLASFEAATNILRHAQPYFSDASIACKILPQPGELVVELIYPGPVFSPPDDPQPDFSGHSEGGFGLYIIAQCVDRADYLRMAPGISCIRLTKRLGGDA